MRYASRLIVGSPTVRVAAIAVAMLLLASLVTGAAVVGASLLATPTAIPNPYGLARNGSLVYEVEGDLYLADADGGNSTSAHARYARRPCGHRMPNDSYP